MTGFDAVREEAQSLETGVRKAKFGPFLLCRSERRLEQHGEVVAIGSRALDILIILVDRAGEVVTRRELLERVWPDLVVEESNLRVHVANLRKLLGDGETAKFIANISGRGYSFIAPVQWADVIEPSNRLSAKVDVPPQVQERRPKSSSYRVTGSLPKPLTRIVGRDDLIKELSDQCSNRRFLSAIGPGGIGKTTVALAVASRIAPNFADGVIFVDLGPVRQPSFVAKTIAAALGVAIDPSNALAQLVEAIGDKEMLLILDCCEHVVEVAAEMVGGLLHYTENLTIFATSREALRADGEWVQRVPPLALPDELGDLTAQEALAFPAVQLFVERAEDSLGGYDLSDADAPIVAEICSKLDGIALAIELAAGRMGTLSLSDLRTQIEDRLKLLRYGRRTALPRHQTLSATLDWSYDLLSEKEQRILNRLSVLHGAFSFEAAANICCCDSIGPPEIEDILIELSAKSLVSAKPSAEGTPYRLLDTTRSYTRRKLEESGEIEVFLKRHARYFCGALQTAASVWETTPTSIWIEKHVPKVEDLRAALNWAFSRTGDVTIGIALVLAAVPLWAQLSLVDEFLLWIGQAISRAEAAGEQTKVMNMQLYAALGGLQMYAISTAGQAKNALEKALELATELDDPEYTLRGLRVLWAEAVNSGELRRSMSFAQKFHDFADRIRDRQAIIVADRLIGTSLHYLGDQPAAAESLKRMITSYSDTASHSDIVRYQFDQSLTARMIYARVLWLQGKVKSAKNEVESIVEAGISLSHTMSLCNILSQCACPIALFERDENAAKSYLTLLKQWTAPRALDVWHVFTECYEAEIEIEFGNVEEGLNRLRLAEEKLLQSFKHHRTSFLITYAKGLYLQKKFEAASSAILEAKEIARNTGEGWRAPELHRWQGEILLASGSCDELVEASYNSALRSASQQGSLAFELRAATSLAQWQLRTGNAHETLKRLASICSRFEEGRTTYDLKEGLMVLEKAGIRPALSNGVNSTNSFIEANG